MLQLSLEAVMKLSECSASETSPGIGRAAVPEVLVLRRLKESQMGCVLSWFITDNLRDLESLRKFLDGSDHEWYSQSH